MIDLIFCFSDPKLRDIAHSEGFLRGANQRAAARAKDKLDFIDCDFKRPDPEQLLSVVKIHRPRFVVCPDIFSVSDLSNTLVLAEKLEFYVDHVIIVPKSDVISAIPKRFWLGYAMPTKFAGPSRPVWEMKGHHVHILGGTPNKQQEKAKYFSVRSANGNSIVKVAMRYGKSFFPSKPHWRQQKNTTIADRLRVSLQNTRASWFSFFDSA